MTYLLNLTRPCKKEGEELVLKGEKNKVKKSRGHKNTYKCEHCCKSFSRKASLKDHSLTCTLQNDLQNKLSTECSETFSSNTFLGWHSVTHTREKTHTCEKCRKHFSQKCALKRHLENSCNEITKKCKSCKKLFRLNETVMLREKLDKCFECHKNAENSLNIKKKPFPCKNCNKSYKNKRDLNRHLLSHSDARPHECKLCEKSFKLGHHLKNHLATHSNEKTYTYKCEKCERYFAKEVYLRNHVMTHTGEKPYQCTYCKRSFTWEKSLKNHLLTHTGKNHTNVNSATNHSLSYTI